MTTATPLVWPEDLPRDVRAWYRRIVENGGTIQSHQRRDLSFQEQKARNTDDREGRTTVRFNEDELRWTQALVDAQLATYSPSDIIEAVWVTNIWKHASIANDGGNYDYYAVVHVLSENYGARDRDGLIIAYLHGAELDRKDNDGPFSSWTLQVKHVKATDFEHDPVRLATFTLHQIMLEDLRHDGVIRVLGILGEASMYGRGNDPIINKTEDPEIGRNRCSGKGYGDGGHTPHPFAPYTVKDEVHKEALREFQGRMVRIEITPRGLVDGNGQLLRKDDVE